MSRRLVSFTLILVLCFVHQIACDDYYDNDDLEETHISKVEMFLKGLMLPLQVADETANGIQEGINSLLSIFTGGPRHSQNSNRRVNQGFGEILNLFKDRFRAVYPGTHWCGAGDIADDENDLGLFSRTDICCRNHDACRDNIPMKQRRSRLMNNGIFTRSSCSCDQEFYQCLKNTGSVISKKIGFTYFNLLRPQCFKQDYPIIGCERYSRNRLIDNKCLVYKTDYNQAPKLQWFDNPDFI